MEKIARVLPAPNAFRELILGIAVLIIGAALLKYADLPTRVSVVESRQAGLEQQLASMDSKLDVILGRIRR